MARKKSMENLSTCTKEQFLEFAGHDNPLLVRDESSNASKKAYNLLSKLILEMDKEQILTLPEREYLLKILEDVYTQRRVDQFLSGRLARIEQAVEHLIEFTISKKKGENINNKDISLSYYNSIRHSVKNEW
jgi:hypothetical protein